MVFQIGARGRVRYHHSKGPPNFPRNDDHQSHATCVFLSSYFLTNTSTCQTARISLQPLSNMLESLRILATVLTSTIVTPYFFLSNQYASRSQKGAYYPASPVFNLSPDFSLPECQAQCQEDWHACATWGMSDLLSLIFIHDSLASLFLPSIFVD